MSKPVSKKVSGSFVPCESAAVAEQLEHAVAEA